MAEKRVKASRIGCRLSRLSYWNWDHILVILPAAVAL